MNASRRARAIALALVGGVFAGTVAAQRVPGAPACVLVAGVASGSFANPQIDKFWLAIEREINQNVFTLFERGGYAAARTYEEADDRGKTPRKPLVALGQSGCAYMLQIANDINADAVGNYFAFDVVLLRFVASDGGPPRPGAPSTARSVFEKRYRYARTQAEMDRFDMAVFANTVFADVQAGGRLEFARTGALPPLDPLSAPAASKAASGSDSAGRTEADAPVYPADARPCVMVSAGAIPNSTAEPDPAAEKFWLDMDRQVMTGAVDVLIHKGYRIAHVFADAEHRASNPSPVLVALRKLKCPTIVSISHANGEDAQHQRKFGFVVGVVHSVFAPGTSEGGPPAVVTEFVKVYDFPYSQEKIDSLRPAELGARMAGDVAAASKLEFARSATLPKPTEAEPAAAADGRPVDPQLLQRSYDAFTKRWADMNVKEVHLREILVASEADARAALARLHKGESFDALARELGTDAATRETGGDIGWSQIGALPVDVAFVAQSAGPDGIATRPARAPQGWAVVVVTGTRPAAVPDFEAMKGRLEAAIVARRAASSATH